MHHAVEKRIQGVLLSPPLELLVVLVLREVLDHAAEAPTPTLLQVAIVIEKEKSFQKEILPIRLQNAAETMKSEEKGGIGMMRLQFHTHENLKITSTHFEALLISIEMGAEEAALMDALCSFLLETLAMATSHIPRTLSNQLIFLN